MSRRYGRNQKRKAREQIASLQDQKDQLIGSRTRLSGEVSRLRDEIDRAKRLAIPFCALFEPTATEGNGNPSDGQPHRMRELREFKLSDVGVETVGLDTPVQIIPLDVIYANLDEDRIRNVMHATVTYRDGKACYGLSRESMASLPREYLVDLITRDISRQLARQIVDRARGTPGRQLR